MSLEFHFLFSAKGQYAESASGRSGTVMEASGTYTIRPGSKRGDPSFRNVIEFSPSECRFMGDGKLLAGPFPIPMDRKAEYYISLSPGAGGQLTLESTTGSDSWGLKQKR